MLYILGGLKHLQNLQEKTCTFINEEVLVQAFS